MLRYFSLFMLFQSVLLSGCLVKRKRPTEAPSPQVRAQSQKPSEEILRNDDAPQISDDDDEEDEFAFTTSNNFGKQKINRGKKSRLNSRAPKGGFLTAGSCSFVAETKTGEVPTCVEVRSRDNAVIANYKKSCLGKTFASNTPKPKFTFDVCKSNASHMCSFKISKQGRNWSELRFYEVPRNDPHSVMKIEQDCKENNGQLATLQFTSPRR